MTDTETPFTVHDAHDPTPDLEDRVRRRVTESARRRRATHRALVVVPVAVIALAAAALAVRDESGEEVVTDTPAPTLDVEPNYQWDTATLSRDGLMLTLVLGSRPPGPGPCNENFVHDVVETTEAVTIGIEEVPNQSPSGSENAGCGLVAQSQVIEFELGSPLGERIVFDGIRAAPRTVLREDSLVEVSYLPDGFVATEPNLEVDEPSQQTFESTGADWYFAVNQVAADAADEFYGDEQGSPIAIGDLDAELITGQMSGTMETIRFQLDDLIVSVWGEMQGPPSFTHRDELTRIARGIRRPQTVAGVVPTTTDTGPTVAPPSDPTSVDGLVGEPAPDVEGATLAGSPASERFNTGRWSVVTFGASWCVPCVAEVDELAQFFADQPDTQIRLVSLIVDDDAAAASRTHDRLAGFGPILVVDEAEPERWGASGLPESFVVDPEGIVRSHLVGGMTADGLATELERIGADDQVPDPIVPDLVGATTDEAVDLLEEAGFVGRTARVQSRYVANDMVAAGVVVSQDIPVGTSVSSSTPIPIEVSAGGPTVDAADLPPQALTLLQASASYDADEPVLEVTTADGTAYKVDHLLFGPCPAVGAAYRTFSDPEYADACY